MGEDNSERLLDDFRGGYKTGIMGENIEPFPQGLESCISENKPMEISDQTVGRSSSLLYRRSTFENSIVSIRNSINVYDTLKE